MANKNSGEMRNLLIASALSMIIYGCWAYFIEIPQKKADALAIKTKEHAELQIKQSEEKSPITAPRTREERLTDSPRVIIKSDSLHGSIALKGLRFDDLTLAKYRDTLAPDSPEVILFSPAGTPESYFAEFGWVSENTSLTLPTPETLWSSDSKELTPEHPVVLSWTNKDGDVFSVKIVLDEQYMFTLSQSVKDAGGKPITLHSYAYVNNVYDTKTRKTLGILHEGPLGVFDGTLTETPYKKLETEKEQNFEAHAGWLGITTDKYWLAAFIPQTDFTGHFSAYEKDGLHHFQTDYLSSPQSETTLQFFAGAKVLSVLDYYAGQYHIPLFDRAIDFGWFYFLTKPIFKTLTYFYALIGNFGVAILLLTVIVKLLMFPLATKSFKSMSRMKELQPKMKDIQERHKDDKLKLNQEIMELYKREKVNPAGGCLPMFIQIPVFFSLYKVLYVTIEMRHAPFFGWIHDLSAPDPTNLFTLFGTIAWTPPAFLHLAIWPMIFCATMVIQQRQSPPPPDPTQAKMMKFLPFIFLFLFSSFPAGLVIYWSWSNTLTILQQWYITATHGKPKVKTKKA